MSASSAALVVLALLAATAVGLFLRLVRHAGGMRGAVRRLDDEVGRTARAFARPVARMARYRRRRRLLTRLLGDPSVWRAAERALLTARPADPGPAVEPYATLVTAGAVGVRLAGRAVPVPAAPWRADDADPRLWWIDRATLEVAGEPPAADRPVVLVALGVDDERAGTAVLLDLATGPALTATTGDARTARSLVQAVAAQLDVRLPVEALQVTAGVHPRFAGPPVHEAWESLVRSPAPTFLVCAELPADIPAGTASTTAVRVVALTGARHRARLVEADGEGRVRLAGTPVVVDVAPLPRAVVRAGDTLPPVPRLAAHRPEEVDREVNPTGVSAVVPVPTPGPPVPPVDDDLVEPDVDPRDVGVSGSGADHTPTD